VGAAAPVSGPDGSFSTEYFLGAVRIRKPSAPRAMGRLITDSLSGFDGVQRAGRASEASSEMRALCKSGSGGAARSLSINALMVCSSAPCPLVKIRPTCL